MAWTARFGLAPSAEAALSGFTPASGFAALGPEHEELLREILGAMAASPRVREPAEIEAGLARLRERYGTSSPDVRVWLTQLLDRWSDYTREHGWAGRGREDRLHLLRKAIAKADDPLARGVASYAALAYVRVDAKSPPLHL